MIRYLLISIIFSLSALFYMCGENVEDPYPPPKTSWVPKSLPEDSVEHGIDADPFGDRIYLEWFSLNVSDLEGYVLYRAEKSEGEEINPFAQLAIVNIYQSSENDTTYYDETVELGKRYLYYLRAFDHAGNRGEPSDTIAYQLIRKPDLIKPVQGVETNNIPVFTWISEDRANEFVLRLETYPDNKIIWISRFPSQNYTGGEQHIDYNFDGKALYSSLPLGGTFRWRLDAISMVNPDNTEYAGSESVWEYFKTGD